MNVKRFALSSLAAFVAIVAFEFVLHGVVLMDTYDDTAHLWRSQEDSKMGFLMAGQFLFACMFTFIFTRHYQAKGIGKGLRYGTLVGLLLAALELGKFCYMPIPGHLLIAWIGGAFVKCILAGLVVALIYRHQAASVDGDILDQVG